MKLVLLLEILLSHTVVAFQGLSLGRRVTRLPSELSRQRAVQGVVEFESWFGKYNGAKCDERITHAYFGGLRGLAWTGESLTGDGPLVVVPSSMVLQSDEAQSSWDSILASKLWKEVLKGTSSSISGYVALLTQGSLDDAEGSSNRTPSSTAPNALRHWTEGQRHRLSTTSAGRALLELDAHQQQDWAEKYQQLSPADRPSSFLQFSWAMEVVHSRAFRGVDQNLSSRIPAILSPVVAGVLGWTYISTVAFPNDAVVFGLGALAVAPSIWNAVVGDEKSVVLLPLIDSANHLDSAKSSIEFNPLSGSFELSLQPSCIVSEEDGQQQLYISYGRKTDLELLLNYGFLPGIRGHNGDDDASRDLQRKELAEAFLGRQG